MSQPVEKNMEPANGSGAHRPGAVFLLYGYSVSGSFQIPFSAPRQNSQAAHPRFAEDCNSFCFECTAAKPRHSWLERRKVLAICQVYNFQNGGPVVCSITGPRRGAFVIWLIARLP